ncbi:hypothetical protein SFRURICE_021087 [Spodoptera frugiperda]|nr:hypothetical protein SFRURICE_021087 [Spodoptera frugiperda]
MGLASNWTCSMRCAPLLRDLLIDIGEVRRVHWHPASLSHVFVLGSDNTIRLYNIALKKGPKLVQSFTIGIKPSSQLAGRNILDSLGDTAVDFTPILDTETLLILRGNGDVYMMQCELERKSPLQPKLSGPLAMYPPADDNYGSESCSITALGGGDTPPLVVVATCSAALYHCLLLPNCTNNTYACVHAGGVHAITLPILGHLVDYALADETESESVLGALCVRSSVARHVVASAAAAGLALSAPPLPRLLVLVGAATLVPRTLEPFDLEEQLYKELQLKNPTLEQDDINNILKERQKLSFTSIIQEILTRDVSQPILQISKKEEPSPKQCLEFLSQATLKLRGEYISRQQRACDAIARKLQALRSLSNQHQDWLQDLQKEIGEVQLQSTVLKEKCMLAEKHQDDLKYRCSAVVRAGRACSAPCAAERALHAELQQHARTGRTLQQHIAQLKAHAAYRAQEMEKWESEYKKKDIALGQSHSNTISSILQQQTSQIKTLMEETKLLKDQLSIV